MGWPRVELVVLIATTTACGGRATQPENGGRDASNASSTSSGAGGGATSQGGTGGGEAGRAATSGAIDIPPDRTCPLTEALIAECLEGFEPSDFFVEYRAGALEGRADGCELDLCGKSVTLPRVTPASGLEVRSDWSIAACSGGASAVWVQEDGLLICPSPGACECLMPGPCERYIPEQPLFWSESEGQTGVYERTVTTLGRLRDEPEAEPVEIEVHYRICNYNPYSG